MSLWECRGTWAWRLFHSTVIGSSQSRRPTSGTWTSAPIRSPAVSSAKAQLQTQIKICDTPILSVAIVGYVRFRPKIVNPTFDVAVALNHQGDIQFRKVHQILITITPSQSWMWGHKKTLKTLTCWDVSGSSLGSCCPNGLSKFASPNFNMLGQDPLFPKQRGQIITAPLAKAKRGVTAQIVSWRPPDRGESLNCRPFECRSLQRHKETLKGCSGCQSPKILTTEVTKKEKDRSTTSLKPMYVKQHDSQTTISDHFLCTFQFTRFNRKLASEHGSRIPYSLVHGGHCS